MVDCREELIDSGYYLADADVMNEVMSVLEDIVEDLENIFMTREVEEVPEDAIQLPFKVLPWSEYYLRYDENGISIYRKVRSSRIVEWKLNKHTIERICRR